MFDLFGHLQCLGTPPQRIQSTRLTQLMVAILAVGTLSPLTAVTASVAPTLAYLRVLPVDQAALPPRRYRPITAFSSRSCAGNVT